MDYILLRNICTIIAIVGTGFGFVGGIGSYVFQNLSEKVAPFIQPIRTASATVEVVIESDADINANFMDSGGYLTLAKDHKPLIITASTQSIGKKIGDKEVMYRGVFNMDASDSAVGQQIKYLQDADITQIVFFQIPKNSTVIRGNAILTINSEFRLEIKIPKQTMINEFILVNDLKKTFSIFNKKGQNST